MSIRRNEFDAVAIITSNEDGRRMGKTVIPVVAHDQAMAIAGALQGVMHVEAIPCRRDFDVFGRIFWTNRVED